MMATSEIDLGDLAQAMRGARAQSERVLTELVAQARSFRTSSAHQCTAATCGCVGMNVIWDIGRLNELQVRSVLRAAVRQLAERGGIGGAT